MAKVEYVDIVPSEEELYWSCLTPQDRFTHARITKKVILISRKKKKGISVRSLLPQIAEAWGLLGNGVPAVYGDGIYGDVFFGDEAGTGGKNEWSDAGAEMGLNGYRLYVQDKTIRIINDMEGDAVPALLHQSWVGNLKIEAPATELKITQLHPRAYWVSKKVYGKKGMYVPVEITEDFALPLEIKLNYKSELESVGEGSFAKFYATVWHSFQGSDIMTNLEINLDLVADWKEATATLTSLAGYVVGYSLFFHLYNVQGDLYVDNIKAIHSGQNWVRDPYCKDINQGFTRAFYQIPKHWVAVTLPSGATYDSIYKDF